MPSLLIAIRSNRWLGTTSEFQGKPDVPGACLADMNIKDDKLSSWLIDDNKTNLVRILTALAANRQVISNIDYLTFDFELPEKLDLTVQNTPGGTPDSFVNRTWHYDLSGLSARRAVEFAVDIFSSGQKDRLSEKDVRKLVEASAGNELDGNIKVKLTKI